MRLVVLLQHGFPGQFLLNFLVRLHVFPVHPLCVSHEFPRVFRYTQPLRFPVGSQ